MKLRGIVVLGCLLFGCLLLEVLPLWACEGARDYHASTQGFMFRIHRVGVHGAVLGHDSFESTVHGPRACGQGWRRVYF